MNQRLLQVLEIKEIILGKIIDGSSLEEQGLATQL